MAGTRVKIIRLSFSTQNVELVELPDIPGVVLEISRVIWMAESASSGTVIGIRLYHDIDVSKTLAFADIPGALWAHLGQSVSAGGDESQREVVFTPPLELVGTQRLDFISSVGTVVGHIQIHYTTRREPNRTLWNELRSRTSFERD